MDQKPTNILLDFLRKRRVFNLSDVAVSSGIERKKLLRVLEKFSKEGFLQKVGEGKIRPAYGENGRFRRNPRYKVIKDITTRQKKQRPICDRDKMWRTIRFLRKFKRSELIRLTGVSEDNVSFYTRKLTAQGVLKVLGRSGKEKVFFLLNDPGPKKPIIEGE